jgi:DNA-binding NtrC family response regulator
MLVYFINGKSGGRASLEAHFLELGHKVVKFDSLARLMKKSHPPSDLIFLELDMPSHKAERAVAAIKARYPGSRLIVTGPGMETGEG